MSQNGSDQGKESELYKRLTNWHLYELKKRYDAVIAAPVEDKTKTVDALLHHLFLEFPIDGVAPTDPRSIGMVSSVFNNGGITFNNGCITSDFWEVPTFVTNEARVVIIMRTIMAIYKISFDPVQIEDWHWFADNFQDFILGA